MTRPTANRRFALALMGSGMEIRRVDPALAEHTARQYEQWDADHGVVDHDPEWEAYLRLLKRIQPDFEG